MNFDEAMHAECAHCGEPAMKHRMTDTGNFYCLEPANPFHYRSPMRSPGVQERWAISHANCNELRKSPLSAVKVIGKTLVANLRGTVSQETLA